MLWLSFFNNQTELRCVHLLSLWLSQLHSQVQDVSAVAEISLRNNLQLLQRRSHSRSEDEHPGEELSDGRNPPETHQVFHNDIHSRHVHNWQLKPIGDLSDVTAIQPMNALHWTSSSSRSGSWRRRKQTLRRFMPPTELSRTTSTQSFDL